MDNHSTITIRSIRNEFEKIISDFLKIDARIKKMLKQAPFIVPTSTPKNNLEVLTEELHALKAALEQFISEIIRIQNR